MLSPVYTPSFSNSPINGRTTRVPLHIFVLCLLLNIARRNYCMGASINSARSYDGYNIGDYQYNYLTRIPKPNYNYPLYSSEETNKEQKPEEMPQPSRINSKYAEGGVEHGRPARLEWTEEEVERRECKEIPRRSRGKVRSVNTHNNCIVLYSREGCRGAYRIVKVGSPSHNRLSDLCFHRKPVTARPCTPEEEGDSPTTNLIR